MADTAAIDILIKVQQQLGTHKPMVDPYGLLTLAEQKLLDFPWPFLITSARFTTTAEYATGTVAVTSGSANIVGTSTVWTSGMSGRKFGKKTSSRWYQLGTFTDGTHYALSESYGEDTESGIDYAIYEDRYELRGSGNADDVGVVIRFRDLVNDSELTCITPYAADINAISTSIPYNYFHIGDGSNKSPRIQLVPPPAEARTYEYLSLIHI